MSITAIANAGAGSANANGATAGPINTFSPAADLIVVNISWYAAGGVPILSDLANNTWIGLTAKASNNTKTRLFYCASPIVNAGHTFTAFASSSYPAITVAAFSGSLASPFDQEIGAFTNSNVTSLQPGSITPSQDNCLLVTGLVHSGSNVSINSSFSGLGVDYGDGTHYGGGIGYKIQTTAAAVNPTWSYTTAGECSSVMASFKAAVVISSGGMVIDSTSKRKRSWMTQE